MRLGVRYPPFSDLSICLIIKHIIMSLGGHCKSFAPEYAKAAENLKNVVNVGAVDCDAEKVPLICGSVPI